MSVWVWIVIAAVIVLVVGLALTAGGRMVTRRRSAALRRRFGTEYDRVVDRQGRQGGEAELRNRIKRRQALPLRALSGPQRREFQDAWEKAQASWVDTPLAGLRDADLLVLQVMRERGYPTEHFDERADLLSVDHADQVQALREAHALAVGDDDRAPDTEQVRQAIVNYRYLFGELLGAGQADPTRTGTRPLPQRDDPDSTTSRL
jgi:hypothetical protein